MEVKRLNIVVVFILIYFIHGFKSLEDLWNMNELTPFVSNNFREIFGDGEQFSDIDVRYKFLLGMKCVTWFTISMVLWANSPALLTDGLSIR